MYDVNVANGTLDLACSIGRPVVGQSDKFGVSMDSAGSWVVVGSPLYYLVGAGYYTGIVDLFQVCTVVMLLVLAVVGGGGLQCNARANSLCTGER